MSLIGRARREDKRRLKLGLPKESKKEAEEREAYFLATNNELHKVDEKDFEKCMIRGNQYLLKRQEPGDHSGMGPGENLKSGRLCGFSLYRGQKTHQ